MIPLGLSSADQAALNDALLDTHSIHVTLQVLDLNGTRLSDISHRLLSGQVNIDRTATVYRSCTLSLLDERRTLNFDSDSPADGALYLDRMIRVIYSVKVGSTWRSVPVFTGPVSKMDRTDDVVNIEAQGKETLAQGAAWTTHTYKKGANRVQTIKDILSDLTGETRFTFPESNARLPEDVSIGRESQPWHVARGIASGLNMQLFYDGRGVCRLRRLPGNSCFDFQDGDGGAMLTTPQITYTTDDLKNIVQVKGAKKISVSRTAARSHPLSPQRLGRNGVPRYLLDVFEDTSIRTKTEAIQVANQRLNDALLASVDVAFDALPIPFLEEGDLVHMRSAQFAASFRVNQLSIPLVVGDVMSLGYLKRVSVNKKRIRA